MTDTPNKIEEMTCSGCGEYAGSHIADRLTAAEARAEAAEARADRLERQHEVLRQQLGKLIAALQEKTDG